MKRADLYTMWAKKPFWTGKGRLWATLTLVFAFLSACGNGNAWFGNTKEAPDEFAVFKRAPLSLPPDYTLRPAKPGAERPQAFSPVGQAESALYNTEKTPSIQFSEIASPGTLVLLKMTGGDRTDPEIRKIVRQETNALATEHSGVGETILFWKDESDFGRVIDADLERRRLQENEAMGRPLTDPFMPETPSAAQPDEQTP